MSAKSLTVCWLLTAVCSMCAATPRMGPAIGQDKKLIKWGTDSPNSEEFRTRVKEFEQWPFDGYVISPDVILSEGKARLHGQMSSTHSFSYNDLKHMVADFRAVKSPRIAENFLRVATAADDMVVLDPGGKELQRISVNHPDWFSDADFEIVASNWALMARIARECGMKGFMLDFEQWGHTNGKYPRPWDYTFLVKHNNGQIPSFEEHEKKYRERGKQLAQAVCKEFPGIVLLSYMTLHKSAYERIGYGSYPDPKLPPLANSDYGLLAAFLDGILEGIPAGSKAVLVDGGAMYTANLNNRFKDYRTHAYADEFKLSKASVSAKKHLRLAFAVWVDGRGWRTRPDWSWPWSETAPYWDNQFTPKELEHAFYYAMLNADKYTWVWSEQAIFFADCGWWRSGLKATINDDYRQAFNRVRQPHPLVFERDPRGAYTDPQPPHASTQPGYSDEETFAPLLAKYDYLMELPTRWRFWADRENVSQYACSYVAQPEWDFNGWNYKNWGWIETGDYYENLGHRFNGHAWYRTEVNIPASWAGKKLYVHFAGITWHPVVGAFCYVNGQYSPIQQDLPRNSTVRGFDVTSNIKPGAKNTFVVCVADYGGPGGIYKRGVRIATPKQP